MEVVVIMITANAITVTNLGMTELHLPGNIGLLCDKLLEIKLNWSK